MSDRLIQLVHDLGRPKVLVVGDYMLDRYIWGAVERISPEAPIPVLKADLNQLLFYSTKPIEYLFLNGSIHN